MKNKKRAFRRILPLFMAMVLCITMQDMTAFAAETAETELKSETIEITGAERYDGEYYTEPALRFPVKQKKLYSRAGAELSLEEYVVAALENYETRIDVSAYNILTSEGSKEYLRILNNNPQLFYVQAQVSVAYTGNQIIYYQPYYLAEKEEAMQMREELETAVQQVLEQVDESMDAVQKALVVHDYLAQNCEYDQERYMAGNLPDISHTSYGALVNRMAVCDGYAGAFAYIMEHKLGIPCTVVSSDQMSHAWNMIEIDGTWYHLDLTWDDPVWDCIGRVTHNYFLLSDQAISQDHYAWTQGYTADSDRYDQEFWIGVESAISYYNGAWYYSEYQSASRKVVLKKKENLFAANAETVYQTSPWQSSGQGFYTASFMYLAQANRKLYFNTSTEIMQMDADGDVQVFYEPDDLAGKQIFGFTVQGSEFLYAPSDVPSRKQSDIRRYSPGETEPSATPSQKPAQPSTTPSPEPIQPSATPSSEPAQSKGVTNLDYTFTGLDGTSVSTSSDSGQATVIIFGRTTCWNSQSTIRSIAASQWVRRSDIRVIFAEFDGASSEDVQSFAAAYGGDDITFCYDEGYDIYRAMWAYYRLFYDTSSVTLPVTVVIDGENQIRHCLTGYQTADAIRSLMDEFVAADPSESDHEKTIEAEFDVTYGQSEARQMLSRINEFRTGNDAWEWNSTDTEQIYHTGLGELTYDYELEKVAMQRAADLVAAYSHTRPDGTSCFSAYSSGFNNMAMGENIAIGYTTEEAVFEGWKEENDPYSGQGHRRNMLSDKYQAVGIAHVVYNGCHYWVQEFSGGVVSAAETPAIDSETTVHVAISKDLIYRQNLKLSVDEIQMEAWTKQKLPQVYTAIRTTETWAYGPSLEFPVTAEWSVSSGEDVVRISEGSLYALKEGDAQVTASYNGDTTEIPVIVASNPAAERVLETLKEYEGKLADYPETEKEELQALLETIKGKIEAARAEGDLETAEAALAKMEAALEEKTAGKKEEAKQELEGLKDRITADEELDDDQRAKIEDVLREAETVIANAKDATAVKEALEDAQQKIEEIKNMNSELKQEALNTARNDALNNLDILESKLGDYRAEEQEKIKNAIAEAKTKIDAAENEDAVKEALEAAKRVFSEQPTDAELKKQEEADKNNQDGTGTGTGTGTGIGTGTGTATLTLSKSIATLYTGKASKTVTINATVTGGTSQTVIWTSSNPNVATVMNGKIAAVKKGTATITATANGISKTVTVTVKNPTLTIKKSGKKFTKKKLTVKKGKKVTLTVTVNPKKSGISIAKLTKKIATVTLKGSKITIKGKKKGTVTLKIKSGKATKKIKIIVK